MEFIQADALARYYRQRDFDVFFATGTDEHGGKNAESAKRLGIPVQQYVDDLHLHYRDFCRQLNVSYDGFTRTTEANHVKRAQEIWRALGKYIYKDEYEGFYDQKEEEFITEDEAAKLARHNPDRYQRLKRVKEENYFFRLSKFNRPVLEAIKDGQMEIVPRKRRHEVLAVLENGLVDISISRPKSKLDWGIAVPGDKNHVMYVWFEALMNYITVLGYPTGKNFAKFWPADVHILGKDVSRFHAIIWPAMLLGLGLELPRRLYVHGFITIEGQKMSKSVGNVVSPLEVVKEYGSDALRYYLLRHIPAYDDGDFSWRKLHDAYNGELGNELGNLVSRLAAMIIKFQDGLIGAVPDSKHDISPYEDAMAAFRFDKALDYVFNLIKGLNQYIETEKPWQLTDDPEHLQEVLAYTVSTILQVADLLFPFIPEAAEKIIATFGADRIGELPPPLFERKEKLISSDV